MWTGSVCDAVSARRHPGSLKDEASLEDVQGVVAKRMVTGLAAVGPARCLPAVSCATASPVITETQVLHPSESQWKSNLEQVERLRAVWPQVSNLAPQVRKVPGDVHNKKTHLHVTLDVPVSGKL